MKHVFNKQEIVFGTFPRPSFIIHQLENLLNISTIITDSTSKCQLLN